MPLFFLDAEGGQFAFLKEEDKANWSDSIYREQTSPDSTPADDTASNVLDTENIRSVICLVKPTSATYKFIGKGYQNARQMPDFYKLEDGEYTAGYSHKKSILIDVQGVDAFYPQITEIDGTKVEIEYAPIPYDES